MSKREQRESSLRHPFPIGSIVRLNDPYEENGRAYQWGLVVRHDSISDSGMTKVGLSLYDNAGQLLLERNHMPGIVTFRTSHLVPWTSLGVPGWLVTTSTRDSAGAVCPTCPGCQGEHPPAGADCCPQCKGRGYLSPAHMAR